jgi:cytochrome P450
MTTERKHDLYSQEFKANSHRVFAQMRQDDPILCQPGLDGKTLIWYVTRYEDIDAILRDEVHFSRDWQKLYPPDPNAPPPPVLALVDNHMLNKDGADHARLRGLVNKAFTPRIIAQMRPRIQTIADELLDQVQDSGEMNLVDAYAFPLPIIVIAELLGIPAEDRDKFRVWSDAVVEPAMDEDASKRFFTLMTDFTDYLRKLFAERRQHPRDDLITALLQVEEQGDRLSEPELFSMVVLLIVAGHETTVTLIGNSVLALLTHPEKLEELKRDPSLWPNAVEEFLRYDSPVERALTRWVTEDVEVSGKLMRRGEFVIPLLASANRDEAQFACAESLDVHRQPNPHIAFGKGVHYCLGAPLARVEAEIALSTLFRRLPNLRLSVPVESLEWRLVPLFRSLTKLPVAWD